MARSSELPDPLRGAAIRWRDAVRTPRRRALIAQLFLTFVAATLIGRIGTSHARIAAALLLAIDVLILVASARYENEVASSPQRTIRRLWGTLDPERAARALRALTLLDAPPATSAANGTSAELASLHIARTLAALPSKPMERQADRVGRRFAIAAFVLSAVSLTVVAFEPWRIVEGADVLIARNGVAPVPLYWLDEVDLELRPPAYLHEDASHPLAGEPVAAPYGTLLTLRGRVLHTGRHLLLSDGTREVPFVDDGSGRIVARWPVDSSVPLRVIARFGDVTVPEPDALALTSIGDRAPEVVLEGAPARISLAGKSEPQPTRSSALVPHLGDDAHEVPIKYEASDDHGLREVHLVLRAGTREDRRVLSKLDGETRSDRGNYVLRTNTDPFVKKSHVPIEVTVEAKDNDPLTGPKWGASAAITLVPPDVGEPDALRQDGLAKVRDALVDSLAARLDVTTAPAAVDEKSAYFEGETLRVQMDNSELETALTASYAGLRVPGRLQAMLRGRMRKLLEAADKEKHAPSVTTHAATVKATERVVLVLDAVIRGLGERSSKEAAKELADVADELSTAAAESGRATFDAAVATASANAKNASNANVNASPTASPSAFPLAGASSSAAVDAGAVTAMAAASATSPYARAVQKMDGAVLVLDGGGKSLRRLGWLGRDLGEIVQMDLLRVARARAANDALHTELAARDLAGRLHQPDPSFGSSGGKAAHAGGESGGAKGSPSDDEGEGDAERAFNEAAHDLEQLTQDHAAEMGKVEQSLSDAESDEDVQALSEEAKRHAKAVRDAAHELPNIGAGSDSWTSKGAAAREHADEMAHALEQGSPADAVGSGRSALNALDEAKRIAAREKWTGWETPSDSSSTDSEKRIDEARKKLEPEVRWAEQALDQLRKKEAQRASGRMQSHAGEEGKLAERARDVSKRGRDQGSLPQPAIDALGQAEDSAHEAAQALGHGDVDRALQAQREAQRQLEMAKQALDDPEGDADGDGDGEGKESPTQRAEIPNADQHKGPEDFRRRVIDGLGQVSGGRQKDAVRRYAEGLLR